MCNTVLIIYLFEMICLPREYMKLKGTKAIQDVFECVYSGAMDCHITKNSCPCLIDREFSIPVCGTTLNALSETQNF